MFGVTPDTSESKLPRFGLSRAVIIRHLQSNVKNVEVKIFQDLQDHDFEQYVVQEDVYFFMAHDGASRNVPGQSGKLDTAQQRYNKLRFRCLIRHLIKGGYAVALVNELEWRDSKVSIRLTLYNTHVKQDYR